MGRLEDVTWVPWKPATVSCQVVKPRWRQTPSQTQASLRSKAHLHLVVPQEQSLAVKLGEWKDRAEGERSTSS